MPGSKKSKPPATPAQNVVSQYKKVHDETEHAREEDVASDRRSIVSEINRDIAVTAHVTSAPAFPENKSQPRNQGTSKPPPQMNITMTTALSRSADPYVIMWNREEHTAAYPARNLGYSHYVPNAISIYETLDAAHRIMSGNRYLRKADPGYLPLAVNTYIAILYHLRILAVRQSLGLNSTRATQCLTRLERVRKLSDFPVPTILKPHFEAICAYKPSDERVNWIVPTLPDNLGGDAGTDIHSLNTTTQFGATPLAQMNGAAELLSQPIPLIMLDWMRHYVSATNLNEEVEYVAAAAGPPAVVQVTRPRYNYKGSFTPFPIGMDANVPGLTTTLAGHTVEVRNGRDATSSTWYMNALGVNRTSGFDFERFADNHNFWKGSRYADLGPALTPTNADLSNIEAFLGLDGNKEWIGDFVDQAAVFCKYMGGAVSFNSLSLTGIATPTIFCDVEINSAAMPANHRNTNPKFYTKLIRHIAIEQTIYEDDLAIRESYAARHLFPSARLTYHRSIDGAAAGTSTYLTKAQVSRVGPYYGTRLVEAGAPGRVENVGPFSSAYTLTGKTVALEGRTEDLREHFYVPEPRY